MAKKTAVKETSVDPRHAQQEIMKGASVKASFGDEVKENLDNAYMNHITDSSNTAYANERVGASVGSGEPGTASVSGFSYPADRTRYDQENLRAKSLEGALRANTVNKKTDILKTAEAFYQFLIS